MTDINNNNNTESTTKNLPQVKKKKATKVVFYLMAILLLCTTALSGYMAYNIYKLSNSDKDTVTTDTPASNDNKFIIPENYTLISNDDLEAHKNESYFIGRDTLLTNIKTMAEDGRTMLRILRTLYPDYLVYSESEGYVFKEINTGLVK